MTDPAPLSTWFEAHADALVLYARQWLDRGGAEDVVQEVFVRLMAQRREPPNVKAWLYACVRNAAISEARSVFRRRRREQTAAGQTPAWFSPHPRDVLEAETVQRAVQDLPERQREILLLRVWSGMTLNEVAQVTGLAISTIFDEYRRGLDGVRRALESTCRVKTEATIRA
jgi:RNA polymerase sigma-70 factor (ECF subfamily)